MNDDEKWERRYTVTTKVRAPISEYEGRMPLCKVYATWVSTDNCKTCPWYNSHLAEWDDDHVTNKDTMIDPTHTDNVVRIIKTFVDTHEQQVLE